MYKEQKRIKVSPNSELGLLLKDAVTSSEPVLVDTGEAVYALSIDTASDEQTPAEGSIDRQALTPEEVARSQEGIRQAAGGWKGNVDADEFKAYLVKRRRTSSRPPVEL